MCTPKVGLFFGRAEIERAQEIIGKENWAKDIVNEMDIEVSRFDHLGLDWFAEMMPKKAAQFAHGYRGCPQCRERWDWFGIGGICSWDRPLVLSCPACKAEFPVGDPASEVYDAGEGLGIGGQHYFLQGTWNAFVVETFDEVMDTSALLWAVTGDERHARRAAVLADLLATVGPTTIGPMELEFQDGRFHYLTSIVNRRKVRWAHVFDLLYHWPGFSAPSPSYPGRSMAENVKEGLLLDYLEDHCAPRDGEWGDLHNHTSDTVRAMLAIGWVLGETKYIEMATEIIPWFFENTIDGQGCYYETSAGYANFSREIFVDMAIFLARMGVTNYFDDPKFQVLIDRPDSRLEVAGHLPRYGDCPADHTPLDHQLDWPREHWTAVAADHVQVPAYGSYPYRLFDDQRYWSRLLATYASSPQIRAEARAAEALMQARPDYWDLVLDWQGELAEAQSRSVTAPSLMGQKGLVLLRSGEGREGRGFLLRFGPSLAHAHDDGMGLNLYGLGRDLSLDIGYDLYGRPMHFGWTLPRISHNAVVVDQDLTTPRSGMQFLAAGGELVFMAAGDTPFQVVEAKNPNFYAEGGVSEYSRMVMLADLGKDFYVLDIFRVTGGEIHDYSFHATHPVPETSRGFETGGVELSPVQGAWTLAGLDERWQKAEFNNPGCSFGERTAPAGYIHPLPGQDQGLVNKIFNPEPGNGYGYLFDLVGGEPDGSWWARWPLGESESLRLWMLGMDSTQVFSALAPTLYERPYLRYCIARRTGAGSLQSKFVSVIEPYRGKETVLSVDSVLQAGGPRDVAVQIRLVGGVTDTILSSPHAQGETVALGSRGETLRLQGRFAAVREEEGRLVEVKLADARYFHWGEGEIELPEAFEARVEKVAEGGVLYLSFTPHPAWSISSLIGELLHITGGEREYAKGPVYRIEEAGEVGEGLRLRLDTTSLTLSRGRIKQIEAETITSTVALPWGYATQTSQETGTFVGRLLVGEESGATTRIHGSLGEKTLRVESTEGFQIGESFSIWEVAVGDRCLVRPWASLKWGKGFEVTANCVVALSLNQRG